MGTLEDEDGYPTNGDIDKVEMFIALFSSVFNTSDGIKGSQYPELETMSVRRMNSKLILKL